MWTGTNRPWRRSAVWLLIRVTLQSFFLRQTGNDDLYKCFMLFYMASLLRSLPVDQLETDFLYAVASKMQRRITKLGEPPLRDNAWMHKWWDQIQAENQLPYDKWLSSLKTLDLGRDMCLHIPELEQDLTVLRGREPGDKAAPFTPDPARSVALFPAYALPAVDDIALEFFAGNPESTSNMLLTLLELWVACDVAATTQCHLLRDYDREIPSEVFQSLLLPREEQMARLIKVETYLQVRGKAASCRSSVFRSFGAASSFSVRFFDQSPLHQTLKEEIEDNARRERRDKIEELMAKTKEYQRLQRLCNAKQCDYATRMDAYGGIETYHHPNCQRHQYLAAAENLEILLHEWPLPDASLEAKSTVYELQVPKSMGAWRDCTLFVIYDLLRCESRDGQTLDTDYSPKVYKGLSRWARGPADARLGIRSTTKPHITTYGRSMLLSEAPTKSDVCVDNGLNYCYFDNALGIVSDEHDPTDKVTELCTYLLPSRSEALQKFLHRSWDQPDGLPPNEAIAAQHSCPEHMALNEFKALASLPLGLEVQWMNILVQLRMPAIDFRQVETCLFVLQVAYQSSPPRGERTGRQGHEILGDAAFATALLDAITGMYAQIKDNWMAYLSLGTLVWITTRLLSLSTDVEVRSRCVSFLGLARPTAMGWARLLSGRAESSTRDAEREQFRGQALDVALVCISTFDVAPDIFHRLTDEAVSILFECSILVQEKQPAAVDSKDILRVLLLARWRRILFANRERLEQTATAASGRSPLSTAIAQSWPAQDPVTVWRAHKPNQHWLVSAAVSGTVHRTMHFNLLTAEFLVNGSPLARLPPDYEAHPMYRVLFGDTAIEVMPSTEPGFRFSGKTLYHGHILHFDLRRGPAGNQDLAVRAINKDSGDVWELLPSRLLQDHFPSAFVERQVHWLTLSDDTIEFRSLDNPWDTSPQPWTLSPRATGGRQLRKPDGCTLISINSPTAATFGRILGPLEDLYNIHSVRLARGGLEIELPRLNISFMLAEGSDLLECRQFRDYFVARCQSIGTLVGLQNRLVVKHKSSSGQLVLIPQNGEIRFRRTLQHVRVEIVHGTADRVQAYEVDSLLGRIVDNGDLPSKLLLCYLHALTSHALPDPLTRHTGTEQALTILDSAAVLSFGWLDQSSIELLAKISALTPGRQYFPAHLDTMQRVEWHAGLGFLAQHGRFFLSVDRIFTHYQTSLIFYLSDAATFRETQEHGRQRVVKDLVERDLVSSSFLRLSGFGAEDSLQRQDHVYQGRDTQVNAERCERVYTASYLAMSGRCAGKIPFPPSSDLATTLWNLQRGSSNTEATQGPNASLGDKFIGFDKSWLKNTTVLFIRHWCRLHRLLASGTVNQYAFSTWLATLAYNPHADMQALQALWVIFSLPDVGMHSPLPARPSFNLFVGREPSKHELRSIVNNSLRKFDSRFSPEARFVSGSQETKQRAFEATRREKSSTFVDRLLASWPSPVPPTPSGADYHIYINTLEVMEGVASMFRIWHDNVLFYEYLETIARGIQRCQVCRLQVPVLPASTSHWPPRNNGYPFIPLHSVFLSKVGALPHPPTSHNLDAIVPRRVQTPGATPKASLEKLSTMFNRLNVQAKSRSERAYVDKLGTSLESLEKYDAEPRGYSVNGHSTNAESNHDAADLEERLRRHQEACRENANSLFQNLVRSCEVALPGIRRLPRLSPVVFLSQLQVSRWGMLSKEWQTAIVDYALALVDLQRASRLLDLSVAGHEAEFNKELENLGHLNWNPHEHTEWLLLEVESAITIRGVQQEIAAHMMSSKAGNAVMQLNMGEGKSSVIVPMVATSLADGGRLVRVIVAKSQSKQMLQMLMSKTTGLLNRRIYHFPFSRPVRLTEADARCIDSMLRECQAQRGILLVQPEHILSFKLMCLERYMTDQVEIGRVMVGTQHYLDGHSRDIVDESDEIFSAKFELIYTMGLQRPTELSPSRWGLIHELLDVVASTVINLKRELPDAVGTHADTRWPGRFPRTRLLKKYAYARFVRDVATKLCKTGLRGFPIALQPVSVRKAVFRYLTEARLTDDEVESVETSPFWTDTTKGPLLLLRGLLAGGILVFTLGSKRWRVNYGPAPNREPPTKLVVPYQSKDIPSPRSEFSHPDVVILLTSLHYYYAGLSDDELFLAMQRLIKADQPENEYAAWVRTTRSDMPRSFQQLAGVSLEDRWHCTDRIFPFLRHAKGAIDYFLSHIVFPKHMKEFPYKISASGWDLGQTKTHAMTGFSGTNDARHLLPLSVTQLDLPRQNHTNALVLEHLLRHENSIHLLASNGAEALLTEVMQMQPAVRVILDVGAQVLELSNLQAAQRWLRKLDPQQRVGAGGASAGPPAEAVVFFDDDDVLSVVDRSGRVENLQASPYAKHLEACLVFLDEAHTRGTDLRLPTNYRAAVTLGADLTKDRLVQACMRMRKLGHGQSVVFCVPEEIQDKIATTLRAGPSSSGPISVTDVLTWSIHETQQELHRCMPLWAMHGRRFVWQEALWTGSATGSSYGITKPVAHKFREVEAHSLAQRYLPRNSPSYVAEEDRSVGRTGEYANKAIQAIDDRCRAFASEDAHAAGLNEEQEHELAPEIEEERQRERPPPATALTHTVHPDVLHFVKTAELREDSTAFVAAFRVLRHTSVAQYVNVDRLPSIPMATADFAQTVRTAADLGGGADNVMDMLQRTAQFILTSATPKIGGGGDEVAQLVLISPFEANKLVPLVQRHRAARLHLYSARVNMAFPPLDGLDLYVAGLQQQQQQQQQQPGPIMPSRKLRVALNLFAGQLYFQSWSEYADVASFLGLVYRVGETGVVAAADGFIRQRAESAKNDDRRATMSAKFEESPVQFLKVLMTQVRRNSGSIEKTHVGKTLDGVLLTEDDFQNPR
ncbi:hypothetical protein SPI_03344 [Niveomyces insectorum RCEF 264]|uniref:ubiquitinyl hydrolase 1 n=1 Tax=Niveomyces insectorum RCEF 264 TaxID=1081102 RepID=A0A167X9K1_9HYPO|nr:hypothetical protein SPI_03344 [Niveomyces insectorum RCEF 264]